MRAFSNFHPFVQQWFSENLGAPTAVQEKGWASIQNRAHTLVAAPTGSGKTLAAFLCAIDALVKQSVEGELKDEIQVVYVSPLKALSHDIAANLERPIHGISDLFTKNAQKVPLIRTGIRTGDTPAKDRAAAIRRPPHILVTTPESLYILLTSQSGRRMLRTAKTLIVDEIHAMLRDKRGSHLSLSMERLASLVEHPLTRIGLSATQKPMQEVARYLVGAAFVDKNNEPQCAIVDGGHRRQMDLKIQMPKSPLEAVMSNEVWTEVYDQLAEWSKEHRTMLVFVNSRRVAERIAMHLSERVGEEFVAAHHGSLSQKIRHKAERDLRDGKLRVLVATASLEMGIDIGHVDLVCQLGTPRAIASLLQRVGRAGHKLGATPKGRLFPLTRDELVECAALLHSVQLGELDLFHLPKQPLDILAQQIVAEVASKDWDEEALYQCLRKAWPYKDLSRDVFRKVLQMMTEGLRTGRGRRGAFIHYDAVQKKLSARKGARLSAITSGGAIAELADFQVRLQPEDVRIGTLDEDFSIESMPGDIFQLGNSSYRILRVDSGVVRVEDAHGQPPNIPFWLGEAPGRTNEVSFSVARLKATVESLSDQEEKLLVWLQEEVGLDANAAQQLFDYLVAAKISLGHLPTQDKIVIERFFDEAGDMHVVLHSSFGSRMNRAWGLSLRKRFCRSFNVELQAAATEDAVILSLSATHSFPLEDVFQFLHSNTVRSILIQAMLDAPVFQTRWRWNANRALMVLRFRGGKKVAPQLQRMESEDLLSTVFPDQVACLENIAGDREVPDQVLVQQTVEDCLTEAMDVDALETLLKQMEDGHVQMIAKDVTEPSPLSQEILAAKPYAFLDDAPLEERRTRAVVTRRWTNPKEAEDLSVLDEDAILRVRQEIWPEVQTEAELHDVLLMHWALTEREGLQMSAKNLFQSLVAQNRATVLCVGTQRLWVVAEKLDALTSVYPDAQMDPPIQSVNPFEEEAVERCAIVKSFVHARLEISGPITARQLQALFVIDIDDIQNALIALETEGVVFRGQFTQKQNNKDQDSLQVNGAQGLCEVQWCERRLLSRIHRYTLQRLRSEIEPVSQAALIRFLVDWQHVSSENKMRGQEGLEEILGQLEGFQSAAFAWEKDVLKLRMKEFVPSHLDALCLSGQFAWLKRGGLGKVNVSDGDSSHSKSGGAFIKSTPLSFVRRENVPLWMLLQTKGHSESSQAEPVSSFLSLQASKDILEVLQNSGALFLDEIQKKSGLLQSQVAEGLRELVTLGLVVSDGTAGLRSLLNFAEERSGARGRSTSSKSKRSSSGLSAAGRWSFVGHVDEREKESYSFFSMEELESIARMLLRRWGVVFRKILDREGPLPPWRDLLRVLRRMEDRGEVRGGRFVTGFSGEQFALPEAVGLLRKKRKPKEGHSKTKELISVSGADPLNLLGIVLPGKRVSSILVNRILFQEGVPIAVFEGGQVKVMEKQEDLSDFEIEKALLKTPEKRESRSVRSFSNVRQGPTNLLN